MWVKLVRQQREQGTLQPQVHLRGRKLSITGESLEQLRQHLVDHPDATLAERIAALDLDCCVNTMWLTIRRLGCRYKKSSRATEQDQPDVARKRKDWHESQEFIDAERLVFLDETGIKTDLTRLRGWSDSSERLVEAIPGGDWETSTLVHAVALDGTRAAMVLDGPPNGNCFTEFCDQLLAPSLQPGDLVILDNLSSHKSASAIAAVERVGAEMIYLPPYSPGLNPIENILPKVKQWIRSLRQRSWEESIDAIHEALLEITLHDLYNPFGNCGYKTT